MEIIKILNIEELKKINDEKYVVVFVDFVFEKKINEIKKNVLFIDKEFSSKIYMINKNLIIKNKEFKDIKIFPSFFFFELGKENPKYFFEGLIDIEKLKNKIKSK